MQPTRIGACVAGAIGLVCLAGWAFDQPALRSIVSGYASMQPWTAVAVMLAATALWLARSEAPRTSKASAIPAIAVLAIAGTAIFQHATGKDLAVDLLLFPSKLLTGQTGAYQHPGRLGPITSVALLLLMGALLLAPHLRRPSSRMAFSVLASLALALTLVALLGYIFRLESLGGILQRDAVALPTALALAALSLGTLALRPDVGWVGVIAEHGRLGWAASGAIGLPALLFVFGSYVAATGGITARNASAAGLRLQVLLTTLIDAETGQRGYLLTGRESYLEPYEAARRRLPSVLAAAEDALSQVGSVPFSVAQLRGLVAARMANLADTIALRRAGNKDKALDLVDSGRGKALMDSIRVNIASFVGADGSVDPAAGSRTEFAAAVAALGTTGLAALAFYSMVVAGRARRKVIETIEVSEERQRDLLATLSLGTFMVRDFEGRIRYWAEGCTRLYGWTSEAAIGRFAHELLGTIYPIPRAEIEAILERSGEWTGDLRHFARDGRELLVTAHKVLRRGTAARPRVVLEFLTDVTAQRRAEVALDDLRVLMHTVIETAPGLIYAKDRQGRMILANNAVLALIGKPVEGRTDQELLEDPGQAEMVMANDRLVMERGLARVFEELAGRAEGRPRVWLSTKAPMRGRNGQITGMVGVSIDITERKRAEDRLRLMVDELRHRVKNTLATVQSFVLQTLRTAEPSLRHAIEGRLGALASVHDVLTRENWEGAGIAAVVEGALAPFDAGARCVSHGPPVRLCPRAALAFAMSLHELGINALKFGALSSASGLIEITWELSDGEVPSLRLVWVERNGPSVAVPSRYGFGSQLLRRVVAQDLGGRVSLDYAATGVVCRIEAPLQEVAAPREPLPLPRVGVA